MSDSNVATMTAPVSFERLEKIAANQKPFGSDLAVGLSYGGLEVSVGVDSVDLDEERKRHQPEVTAGLISYYERIGFQVDEEYREETGVCWMFRSFNTYAGAKRYWSINDTGS